MEASTVATLATWPLAARYFGTLSLAAPLTNLLVIPLVAPAMALGLVQGLLWPVAPALAKAAGAANAVVLGAILGVTSVVARWPWSAVDVTPPGTAAVVASLALLFALLALRRRPSLARRLSPALVPAGASAVALYLAWRAFWPVPLTVTFLDVGQGDAILLQTPGGRSVLVDAGGRYEDPREARKHGVALSGRDVGERVVVPALRRAGVRRLDVLVLTHPHEDHAGGLPAVMAAFPVALWLDGGGTHPSPGYREALHMAGTARTPRHLARAGERLALGDGVSLEILAPDPERPPGSEERLNDTSLVCRVVYGRTSLLLSGDAETAEETSLLRSGADLRADLVKVGHHGGSSSAGEAFLAAVRPAIAVISCGRNNRYGHPADQMLLRAAAAGAHVYRTDVDGAVVITSDGRRLRVRTSRWFMP